MPDFWERHFVRNEFIVVTLATGVLIAWAVGFGGSSVVDDLLVANRAALYGTIASIAGALLGFLITTVALLQGIVAEEGFRRLRASDQYPTLWRVFHLAIRSLAATCGIALLGLLLDRDTAPVVAFFYCSTWAVLISAVLVVRAIWILERVLRIATSSADTTPSRPKPQAARDAE